MMQTEGKRLAFDDALRMASSQLVYRLDYTGKPMDSCVRHAQAFLENLLESRGVLVRVDLTWQEGAHAFMMRFFSGAREVPPTEVAAMWERP